MVKKMGGFVFFLFLSIFITVNSHRLPTSVIPKHYKIQILTHLDGPNQFQFIGRSWIQVLCNEATQSITLHSKGLNITNSKVSVIDVSQGKTKNIKVKNVHLEPSHEFLVIDLDESLEKDHTYQIYIPFVGILGDGLKGFYRSSYIDAETKEKKWVAVTQFEATDARRAFPCFDEPAMKATFEIILGRKEGLTSISNMPLLQTDPIKEMDGWFWDKFQPSVPMSTYLVAFLISDFDSVTSEPTHRNNVTFKIWARHSALDQVHLASEIGPKALEFFEDYFTIDYPLPKQDMIAVPDFNAGAMENWGLITFRESLLLFEPKVSSLGNQRRIASVIAHELAHQWFGNLVTMKWWSDLWLNEGFATYMASLAVDTLFPKWKHLDEENTVALMVVFSYDALRSSHPIVTNIKNPNNVEEIFDPISYRKGAFLLRMMSLFLGGNVLRKGVNNYLMKYKYTNAEQDNLWATLTEEAHKVGSLPQNLTVKTVMDSWTLQTGYPLVTVTRNYKTKTAEIVQHRYIKDAVKLKGDEGSWWVPLSYTDGDETDFKSAKPNLWLSQGESSTQIQDLPDSKTWVLFNIQAAGLFKVNYDEHNWRLLSRELQGENHTIFPIMNKVQLLDDAFDLAWTGELSYDILFDLLRYLEYENEYLPWKTALSNAEGLTRQLMKTSIYGLFKSYMGELIGPIFDKLGGLNLPDPRSTPYDAISFQVMISDFACRFEIPHCVSQAKRIFEKYQKNPSDKGVIPSDLRDVIYCTAIRLGGEKEWEFLWNQYKKANVATEKNTILSALGCTKEIWLLRRYLEWSISDESGIRRQDVFTVSDAVTSNNIGYYIAKNFVYTNIKDIYRSLSDNSVKISRVLSPLGRYINSEADFHELQTFVKDNQPYLKQSKQGVEQTIENAKLNVQWQQRHYKEIEQVLRKYLKTTPK